RHPRPGDRSARPDRIGWSRQSGCEAAVRSRWSAPLSLGTELMADNAFASLAPLEPLMDKCVHCGFCLPACPSYLLLGRETDSPRGRIYAMRAGVEGRIGMTAPVVEHFDTCLGCMACETACPSGVRYAPLIEQTRAAVETQRPRPAAERWFRRVLF